MSGTLFDIHSGQTLYLRQNVAHKSWLLNWTDTTGIQEQKVLTLSLIPSLLRPANALMTFFSALTHCWVSDLALTPQIPPPFRTGSVLCLDRASSFPSHNQCLSQESVTLDFYQTWFVILIIFQLRIWLTFDWFHTEQ